MGSLKDKVAFVTGSSRGIGAAVAKCLVDQGAKVAIHGRDQAALARVAADIGSSDRVIRVTADVTQFDEIEAARHTIEQRWGPVELLVANAGGSFTPPGPIEETSVEGWRASVEGNLTATFLTIKSFLPGMKLRKAGSIITLSSAAGRRPHARAPIAYAAAKAGIELMTQDVAAQAGPYGIRVNCIAPDTILTERNVERIPPEQMPGLVESRPIRRLGTTDDVARAALFLLSDDSSWITGAILDVGGGSVMVR